MIVPTFILYGMLVISGIIYSLLILFYTVGWFRLRTFRPGGTASGSSFVSVIIPARNEAGNIRLILEDLLKQSLAKDRYEVIVVDDHSTDGTDRQVLEFKEAHPAMALKLIRLTDDHQTDTYKKKAIGEAIRESAGDLIVTTDADCRTGTFWLETLLRYYEQEKPRMIVGPVCFHNESTFFEKMQGEEFLSLIAITGGAIRMSRPIMCNGANLAYEKEAFEKAGGFGTDRFSSGDDVFLMFRIRKLFGNRSIRFIKSKNSLVFTEAKKNLSEFLHQRTRWASKNKGYELNILFVSMTVYLVNLLLLSAMLFALFIPESRLPLLIALLIKFFIDLPILLGIGNFVKRPRAFVYAIPLAMVYPLYIVVVGAMGVLGNYQWKGRQVKN